MWSRGLVLQNGWLARGAHTGDSLFEVVLDEDEDVKRRWLTQSACACWGVLPGTG